MIPRADLGQLIEELSGYEVVWTGKNEPGVIVGGLIRLAVKTIRPVGTDEIRRVFDEDTNTTEDSIHSTCVVTISVTLEMHDQDVLAVDVLESLRVKLQRDTTVREELKALGFAIVKFEPINGTTITRDEREVEWATLDFHANFAKSELDESSDGGIIETVNTTNEVPGTLDP